MRDRRGYVYSRRHRGLVYILRHWDVQEILDGKIVLMKCELRDCSHLVSSEMSPRLYGRAETVAMSSACLFFSLELPSPDIHTICALFRYLISFVLPDRLCLPWTFDFVYVFKNAVSHDLVVCDVAILDEITLYPMADIRRCSFERCFWLPNIYLLFILRWSSPWVGHVWTFSRTGVGGCGISGAESRIGWPCLAATGGWVFRAPWASCNCGTIFVDQFCFKYMLTIGVESFNGNRMSCWTLHLIVSYIEKDEYYRIKISILWRLIYRFDNGHEPPKWYYNFRSDP